jgi:tetratricopeptide (TPR) repeat protein
LDDPTEQELAIYERAKELMDTQPYEAIKLAKDALENGQAIFLTGKFEYLISYIYYGDQVLPKAAEHAYKAIRAFSASEDRVRMGNAYFLLGNIYFDNANMDYAIESYKMSAEIRKMDDTKEKYAKSVFNLANAYAQNKQFHYSKHHYLELLDVYRNLGSKVKIGQVYNALGVNEAEAGNLNEAVEYYLLALESSSKTEGEYFRSFTVNHNLGRLYLENGLFADADKHLNKALELSDEYSGLDTYVSATYVSLGKLHRAKGQYEKAEENFKLAILHGNHLENRADVLEAHAGLKELYQKNGKKDLALLHSDKYQLINSEAKTRFDDLYAKRTEYGEALTQIFQKEQEYQMAKNKWYNQQFIILIILCGSALLYAAVMNWGRLKPATILNKSTEGSMNKARAENSEIA